MPEPLQTHSLSDDPPSNNLTGSQRTEDYPQNQVQSGVGTLKRRASSTFQDIEESSRKRLKEDVDDRNDVEDKPGSSSVDGDALANDLEQELQCGCCSALVYRPVIVSPCQHFFCGSCLVLWIRNGGANCPACRGTSSCATPSRALQTMADVLVRADPSRARTASERMQADEIYKSGLGIRIPTPRQASPEPTIPPSNNNVLHPCPHCLAGNQWGWRCTQPIVDPEADPDNAWHTDEGTPPGHGYCGNCESLLSLNAPSTSKCDFCQVSFCGIGIPGRCVAAPLLAQHPHGLSDLGDLLQCTEVYESFDHNAVEVDIMFDYLTSQNLSPRSIYREIITIIQRSPRQFAPLFEQDLFTDMHVVPGGVDPDPSAFRSKICRMCASEVLLWGLRDWWVSERKKGYLEASVARRPDCPEGGACLQQKDHAHAKDYNHIISPPDPDPIPAPSQPSTSNGQSNIPPEPSARHRMEQPPLPPPLDPILPPFPPEPVMPLPDTNFLFGSSGLPPFSGIPENLHLSSSQDQVNALL